MDRSSSEEVEESDNVIQQPHDHIVKVETTEETKINTFMGYELYWDAVNGNISPSILEKKDQLQSLLTPNQNTVLHIYITSLSYEDTQLTEFVEEILRLCPSLLLQTNVKGETLLHLAARYGHASIVKLLINQSKALHAHDHERGSEKAKQMLRMITNDDKDTAFHEAVRFRHLSVVKMVIEEDGDFQYSANKAGETPLYMAAERGYNDIVYEILDNCKSPATAGPNGRNVLHAATIRKDEEMIGRILDKMGDLMLKEPDEMGWTPLHHAANTGYLHAVELFVKLPTGREAAYMKDTKGNTALHLAAASNHKDTTDEIIKWCPECCELVNNKGWNILHSAVQNHDPPFYLAMDTILEENAFSNLLNEKDDRGNTPLHHIAISLNSNWLDDLIDHPRVDKMAFNKQNQNALDLASTSKTIIKGKKKRFEGLLEKNGLSLGIRIYSPLNDEEEDKKDDSTRLNLHEEEENKMAFSFFRKLDKDRDATLIVATLIATVTFAAGFTIPGGFYSEKGALQGTPILGNNSAFKTFIIMDTVAMVLSSSAVFIHLFLRMKEDKWRLIKYSAAAFYLTGLAMAAMVVAFATGTYSMLGYSTALSVVTCVIGLSFFISFFLLINSFVDYSLHHTMGVMNRMLERGWTVEDIINTAIV